MTIYNTAYDTFIGRPLLIKATQEALQDIQVSKGGLEFNYASYTHLKAFDPSQMAAAIITPGTTAESAVPVFYHPMPVTVPVLGGSKEQHFLVGDARSFMGKNRSTGVMHVANTMEFEFLQARVGLGTLWLTDGPQMLRFLSPMIQSIFASWLSENITRRFALDMGQQMRLQVLAGWFYQCLFTEEEEYDNTMINRMAVPLAKAVKAPVSEATSILTQIGHITSVDDFVNKVRIVLDNPRLENFNSGVLATIISGTWFGVGGKEVACAALEHPPTFMAMVYIGLAQRGFKNAPLTNIIERYKGPKGGDDFLRAVKRVAYAN